MIPRRTASAICATHAYYLRENGFVPKISTIRSLVISSIYFSTFSYEIYSVFFSGMVRYRTAQYSTATATAQDQSVVCPSIYIHTIYAISQHPRHDTMYNIKHTHSNTQSYIHISENYDRMEMEYEKIPTIFFLFFALIF